MRSVSWIVAICLLLHGCSSLVMMKPRTYRPAEHGEPSCWGSYAPPAVDALIAASALALGAGATAFAVDNVEDTWTNDHADAYRLLGMIGAGLGFVNAGAYTMGSAYGVREAKRCRSAHERYRLHLQRAQGEAPARPTE